MNKKKFLASGLSLFSILCGLTPNVVHAESKTTPVMMSIVPTEIDLTISDAISMQASASQTDATVSDYTIVNNSSVGVMELSHISVTPTQPYKKLKYDTDFNTLSINSRQFALAYDDVDLFEDYDSIEFINPQETLTLSLTGKLSISSTPQTNQKVADIVSTFGFTDATIEGVITDGPTFRESYESLKRVYTENGQEETFNNISSIAFTSKAIPEVKKDMAISIAKNPEEDNAYMYIEGDTMYVAPEVEGVAINAVGDCNSMFSFKQGLKLDFSNLNTSYSTSMSDFIPYANIAESNISNLNTSRVRDMSSMLSYTNLTGVDLSFLDTSNVESMSFMFGYVTTDTLDLSSFDVRKLKRMEGVFAGAQINTLILSGWNLKSASNFEINASNAQIINVDYSNVKLGKNIKTLSGNTFTASIKKSTSQIWMSLMLWI